MEDVATFKLLMLDATDPDHMLDDCIVVVTSTPFSINEPVTLTPIIFIIVYCYNYYIAILLAFTKTYDGEEGVQLSLSANPPQDALLAFC